MDEAFKPTEEVEDPKQADQPFMRRVIRRIADNKRKAAAATAAVAVGIAAQPAIESRHSSEPVPKADVPFQAYGKDGYPKPKLIVSQSKDPIAEGIRLMASNNPFENAQQLLWLAAHTNFEKDKLSLLRIWPGYIAVSGVTIYHAPVGSKHFMPFTHQNAVDADKLVVPQDEVALIENPVFLKTYSDEPEWILATKADNSATTGRATNVKEVYWLSLDTAEQKQAEFLAPEESSTTRGYAAMPEGYVTVNTDGNFQFGTLPGNQISFMTVMKKSKLKKLGLAQATPPPDQ